MTRTGFGISGAYRGGKQTGASKSGTATGTASVKVDIEGVDLRSHGYAYQMVLNRDSDNEVRGEAHKLKMVQLSIQGVENGAPLKIANDSDGDPKMPEVKAELLTNGIDTPLEIYWRAKVEYVVNSSKRPRAGLQNGNTDGFVIPASEDLENRAWECPAEAGGMFTIDWGENFGGGECDLEVKSEIEGTSVNATYEAVIEGEEFDNAFKESLVKYLDNPDSDQAAPTLRTQVAYDKILRVIAYIESSYRHFYPSIYGMPAGAIYPRENEYKGGDGGLGVMQLTEPMAIYEQAWSYRKNIDASVDLLKDKLKIAKAYPSLVRTKGCSEPPIRNEDGSIKYYRCRPVQIKNDKATDFTEYESRMDLYSLYNSNWHYWRWDAKEGWQSRLTGNEEGYERTGSHYVDKAKEIEANNPKDF